MSAVTRSPSHRRASAPRTCSTRSDERSTDARPSSSASTCSQGSVVAVAMVLGASSQPWTPRRRRSPGRCWSRTTTRHGSGGSSARSRRSGGSCLPTGCRSWRPCGRAPRRSTRPPRTRSCGSPRSSSGRRPRSRRGSTRSSHRSAWRWCCSATRSRWRALGPRLAKRGTPYLVAAHGFDYWLSVMPGAHTMIRYMTSAASRVPVMCSEFIARTVRTAVPAARPGVDPVPGRGPATRSAPTCRRPISANDWGWGSGRWSCASAGWSPAKARTC